MKKTLIFAILSAISITLAVEIDISGRVTDGDKNPMSGVTVRLKQVQLSTTTDSDGNYRLHNNTSVNRPVYGSTDRSGVISYDLVGRKITSSHVNYYAAKKVVQNNGPNRTGLAKTAGVIRPASPVPVADTVVIEKDGETIAEEPVKTYVIDLPETHIIQRDLYGNFSPSEYQVETVEATIWGDGINNSHTFKLGINRSANAFSGFLYTKHSKTMQNYKVYVNLYDKEKRMVARSETVEFNSLLGDIQIPVFSAKNAYPVADAGEDITVKAGTEVQLIGNGHDNFGGKIVKYSWSVDGKVLDVKDTIIKTESHPPVLAKRALSADETLICTLTVIDNEGLISTDVKVIQVGYGIPIVYVNEKMTVMEGEAFTIKARVTDDGGITHFWKINYEDFIEGDESKTFRFDKTSIITYRAQDTDGNSVTKNIEVTVLMIKPSIEEISTPRNAWKNADFKIELAVHDNKPVEHYWKIGDGEFEKSDTCIKVFNLRESTTIAYKVIDSDSNIEIKEYPISVTNNAPTGYVNFPITEFMSVYYKDSVKIKVNATDQNNDPLTYEWNFGNGYIEGDSVYNMIAGLNNIKGKVRVSDDEGLNFEKEFAIETSFKLSEENKIATINKNQNVFYANGIYYDFIINRERPGTILYSDDNCITWKEHITPFNFYKLNETTIIFNDYLPEFFYQNGYFYITDRNGENIYRNDNALDNSGWESVTENITKQEQQLEPPLKEEFFVNGLYWKVENNTMYNSENKETWNQYGMVLPYKIENIKDLVLYNNTLVLLSYNKDVYVFNSTNDTWEPKGVKSDYSSLLFNEKLCIGNGSSLYSF